MSNSIQKNKIDRKALYKLMNNNAYGKTMEKVKNIIDGKHFLATEKAISKGLQNHTLCC